MANTQAMKVKLKGFALIRDKDGKPKIDNWKKCPDEIKLMLTEEERAYFKKQDELLNNARFE